MRARRSLSGSAAAWAAVIMLAAPIHAAPNPADPPVASQQTAAPAAPAAPAPPAAPAAPAPTVPAAQQPASPPLPTPQYDTQPPGVSAYLPTDTLITILVITALFILSLRYGPTLATTGIKALLRLFQNTPPAP
ncbi:MULTISPECIES: hypothetical protein [unclassified Streptomyces]|uniref:hypothetical protein n=1 Tax=unclassified Streptomyces TaxID=2593676 RepID=UPI002E34DC49|nr:MULTISPECIES: hypothetical protein [unclassified Streptomyces]